MKLKLCFLFILSVVLTFGQSQLNPSKNVTWRFEPNLYSPSDPESFRIATDLNQSDFLVVLNCSDSSVIHKHFFTIPSPCLDMFQKNKRKLSRGDLSNEYIKCLEMFYGDLSNEAKRDTIYTSEELVIYSERKTEEERFFDIWMEVGSTDTSFHLIVELYTIDELKNICITGPYFRTKSIEEWQGGLKFGIWKYFDKTGKLIRKEEYKSGKLIKEENY